MVVFRATCAVRVPGAFGRGGLAACKARAGQLCSCVYMVQRMAFRALNMVRVQDQSIPGIRHARGAECCQLVGNTHDSPLCVTKHCSGHGSDGVANARDRLLSESSFHVFVTV